VEEVLISIAVDAIAVAVVVAVAILLYRGRAKAIGPEELENYSFESGISGMKEQMKNLRVSMNSMDKSMDETGRIAKRIANDRRRS